MSNSKQIQVPALKDLGREILKPKHQIALFNAYLHGLVERMENGESLDIQQEFDRVDINKLIEKVSGLILESDRLKLNLQKLIDICKEGPKPGERISRAIQEVGSPTQTDSSELVTIRGKRVPIHPPSKTDSGISMDDRLSRPESNASNQYLPTTAEACETEDRDQDSLDPRISVCTRHLLTTQAETATNRRVNKTPSQRDELQPTKRASTL